MLIDMRSNAKSLMPTGGKPVVWKSGLVAHTTLWLPSWEIRLIGAERGVGDVEVALQVLGDRVREGEAAREDRHRVGPGVDAQELAVGRIAVSRIDDEQ